MEEEKYFDYSKEPGLELNIVNYEKNKPVITVVMPFYNDKAYINQSVNCILNQTFPLFELLIIDDGSKDQDSLEELKKIEKLDDRIRVFHKENEGLAATRDYGAQNASKETKYLMFLDSDDLISETYFECAYWTLETNKEASWTYTDSVGFEGIKYTWNKWFNSERLKKINDLTSVCVIRKEAFFEVNGYELREKAVNEDWNFWLKLIAKGKFPVRMNFYGMWYRRKKQGELKKSIDNKERSLKIIKNTAKLIKKPVKAIQYPKYDYNWEGVIDTVDHIIIPKCNNDKINILMIIPWMVTGGADKFNLDLISGLDKNKFNVIVIATEPNINNYRQKFEEHAIVYDLTTFLDQKYWTSFIQYIIEKNNINLIFNTNSKYGYATLPYLKACYPNIPILDYIHMEEWYNRNGGYSRDSSAVASMIDKTLVCNKGTQNVLIEHFKRDPNEVDTVYIGVDEKAFDPQLLNKEELIKQYEIPNNKYVIGFICRITEQKRPYLLVQIIKKLKEKRDDFIVLIVGNGNLLNKVKQEIKKYNLDNYVKFLGNVHNTKEIYRMCDLTLNCSIKEGLALTSYESLAMGVPVISSDVGGQKELINQEVGIIVPCMQKETEIMNFQYKDEEIESYVVGIDKIMDGLETYKENCRKVILEGFTIDQMVTNISNIFETTVKNPNKKKIANAKGMNDTKDISKEIINLFFVTNELEYSWLCDEYNRYFSFTVTAKRSVLKEKLWTNPLWRVFVKILQKVGIMRLIKKLTKRN